MYGAIIGDIVGSRFEFNNHRSTEFQLFHAGCSITDDTVCTVAVAEWLMRKDETPLAPIMQSWCKAYPNESYGGRFRKWITNPVPYDSFGNGSAMRVSPVGLFFNKEQDKVLHYAGESAKVSHNHPEGIKGAQAVALAVYLAKSGGSKAAIQAEIEKRYRYNITQNIELIRLHNQFDETCQVTVPQAIICFLESTDFENAIRLAISIGGDSDTIAAITGSIAGAFYGVPAELIEQAKRFIPNDIQEIIEQFERKQILISKCRYYKGENECPESLKEVGKEQFWFYESKWIELYGQFDNSIEYYGYGLQDFEENDGVPISLKQLLFNRYMHWTGWGEGSIVYFKSWYLKYYIGNDAHN